MLTQTHNQLCFAKRYIEVVTRVVELLIKNLSYSISSGKSLASLEINEGEETLYLDTILSILIVGLIWIVWIVIKKIASMYLKSTLQDRVYRYVKKGNLKQLEIAKGYFLKQIDELQKSDLLYDDTAIPDPTPPGYGFIGPANDGYENTEAPPIVPMSKAEHTKYTNEMVAYKREYIFKIDLRRESLLRNDRARNDEL